MNTIKYQDLKKWYLENKTAKENAKKYFENNQPSIFRTGFYSSPNWNWGYEIGIVGVNGSGHHDGTDSKLNGNGIQSGTIKWFEVVTQFGRVVSALEINLPLTNWGG